MTEPIVVTGGTGTIGRRVVARLATADRQVRVLSRHGGADEPLVRHVIGDTVSGAGLAEAFAGAEVVVHLAGGAKGDDVAAARVAREARDAGVGHLLLISVVGADRMPIGYFRAKDRAEQTFAGSGVPWTVLRVAQLHEFVLPIVRIAGGPLAFAPRGMRVEPVDVEAVGDALAAAAVAAPAGRLPDLAGPEVLTVAELIQQRAAVQGRGRRRILTMPLPGAAGRAYRDGANLAGPAATRIGRTWRHFLADEQLRSESRSPAG